ncbi:MAG TPA: ATP-dependent zinc metalloprotease FtsH [Candidatus Megaira endosymbiont of Hartmannula sinica]|nr:ATP-dependent zinc metalloprotease FtsH [Candidatus Megaera endosymbiont of Hartmannula sinica]
MKKNNKQFLIWALIFVIVISLGNLFQDDLVGSSNREISFSSFLDEVNEGRVDSISIQGNVIRGVTSDNSKFFTYAMNDPDLVKQLRSTNVEIKVQPSTTKMGTFLSILISWFPMLLFIGIWFFFIRQMQGGGKGMGFGRSKAKLDTNNSKKTSFKDVAGINEEKEELQEIVDFLRDPRKFQKIGGKIPKGCLLVGPPGTGKTLLARAIAGEAKVPFFSVSGSDFVEMFVGVGASRVRDMFEQGKKNAPCIIFIDEIDAVGRHRGKGGSMGGHDEREQTLNQMLVEMDGFESSEGVIIIAATNRPDVLDPALLRPGRFDRQIHISAPDINGREAILKVYANKIKKSDDIDLRVIARGTVGFTGAKLESLVNEAALIAARKNKKKVDNQDFDYAKDKILMGVENRSMAMTDLEKERTAYHEAGHAIVGLFCKDYPPIHKATIVPRGGALGMVMPLPENDGFSETYMQMIAFMNVAMGGKAAEEIIYGKNYVTSGAAQDIKVATRKARAMVTKWGMSKELGNVFYAQEEEGNMMSSSGSSGMGNSNNISQKIDDDIKEKLDKAYSFAKKTLENNIDTLHLLAKTLLDKETLSGQEIEEIVLKEKKKVKIADTNKEIINQEESLDK